MPEIYKKNLLDVDHKRPLEQCFLTYFAPWTPKSQNNFHGPLKCYYVLLADPLIPVKEF